MKDFRIEYGLRREGPEARAFQYFETFSDAVKERNRLAQKMNSLHFLQIQEFCDSGWKPVRVIDRLTEIMQ